MNTVTERNVADKTGMFGYLPVALFGAKMGLTALKRPGVLRMNLQCGVMDRRVNRRRRHAIFIVIAIAYGIKAIPCFQSVHAVFYFTVASSTFGTVLISMLLLPILIAAYEPGCRT